ncbi:MAG TPA: YciI family protein [Patescibacteria group bacterium]|nr:YciI family protein [Patescibacteria group bacterium]
MRYLLLIHNDEANISNLSPTETEKLMAEFATFTGELKAAGAHQASSRLRPVATATTVRVRDGRTITSDGPFAETKEQLGGYYQIEAADLDVAIRWASKIPSARMGCVEVRPLWEMPE